jgi:hypothetical protein
MRRSIVYWALAGAAVPVVFLMMNLLRLNADIEDLMLLLWPSSFFLMAPIWHSSIMYQVLFVSVVIAVNVVLYVGVGLVVSAFLDFVAWLKRHRT